MILTSSSKDGIKLINQKSRVSCSQEFTSLFIVKIRVNLW